MATSLKVAELKQSLSFRSLRLMERTDLEGSRLTSFSDSEIMVSQDDSERKKRVTAKSKSEMNLNTSNQGDEKHNIRGTLLKVSTNFDTCALGFQNAEMRSNPKIVNYDFRTNLTQNTLQCEDFNNANITVQTNITEEIDKSYGLVPQDSSKSFPVFMNVNSGQKEKTTAIIENNKPAMDTVILDHDTATKKQTNSVPYPILESNQKSEHFLGEPRCLALKKNDVNPFLIDDALIFEPDFEDDSGNFSEKQTSVGKEVRNKLGKFINDMFVDEDEISTTKKKGLSMDREEGELTPEKTQKSAELNKTKEVSASEKKDTLEFFNKINECLRDLNDRCRDFYSNTTPDYSIDHLQRTLGNVDNIKRKLAFLVKSKNAEKGQNEKLKKPPHKSHPNIKLQSERMQKSNSSINSSKHESVKHAEKSLSGNVHLSYKNDVEELYRKLKEDREKRNIENYSRHSHRREKSSRDRPSQADLLNRKKISMLEKLGTKQEIERVQSLFKRQMNLITQHVIQKKENDKKDAAKQQDTHRRRRRRYSSQSQEERDSKKSHDKVSLGDLKTLDDMEAFLDSLKKDKVMCDKYMSEQKSKSSLKFTSKREKRITPIDKIITMSSKTSKNLEDSFKQPLNKDSSTNKESIQSEILKGKLQKVELKQNDERQKLKNLANIVSVSKSSTISRSAKDIQPRKSLTSNDYYNQHSKPEFILTPDCVEVDNLTNKTGARKHSKSSHGAEVEHATKPSKQDQSEQIQNVEQEPTPCKVRNTSGEEKQNDFKRKYHDLVDINLNESGENETDRQSKKKKGGKYLAALRLSDRNESKNTPEIQPQANYGHDDEKPKINDAQTLVKDLLSNKIVILDDNGVAINKEFCVKVIGNEVFLKKVSNKRKRKRTGRHLKPHQEKNIKKSNNDQNSKTDQDIKDDQFTKSDERSKSDQYIKGDQLSKSNHHSKSDQHLKGDQYTQRYPDSKTDQYTTREQSDEAMLKLEQEALQLVIDPETVDKTLNEMEDFLQDLRSKRKVHDDDKHQPIENASQNRELKFLARIQAKRKAKLMACVSEGVYSTEKEAKFLKAFEKRDDESSESSDVETRKQAFLEKSRAEKDAIAEKPKAKHDDDPLKDVKAFLDMIKEAESTNDENAKQVYVSFSLKRSDVKKLENLTTGKASLLTEESQKFLNSVRSKMKAKKAPVSGISALMRKPEE